MAGVKLKVQIPRSAFRQLDRLKKALDGLNKSSGVSTKSLKSVSASLKGLGPYAAAAAVVIWGLKKALDGVNFALRQIGKGVAQANSIARMQVIFEQLEGSSDLARNSIQRFLRLSEETPFSFDDIANAARYFQTLNLASYTTTDNLRSVADAAVIANSSIYTLAQNIGRTLDDLRSGRKVGQSVYSLNRIGLGTAAVREEIERLQKVGTAAANRQAWELLREDLKKTQGTTKALNNTFAQVAQNIQTKLLNKLAEASLPVLNGLVPALQAVSRIISSIDVSLIAYAFETLFNDVINPGLRAIARGVRVIANENRGVVDSFTLTTRVILVFGSVVLKTVGLVMKTIAGIFYGVIGGIAAAFTKLGYIAETAFYSIAGFAVHVFESILNTAKNIWADIKWIFENGFTTTATFIKNTFYRLKSTIITGFVVPVAEALNNLPGISIDIDGLNRSAASTLNEIAPYESWTPRPPSTEYRTSKTVRDFERKAGNASRLAGLTTISRGYNEARDVGQDAFSIYEKGFGALGGVLQKIALYGIHGNNKPVDIENEYLDPTFRASSETAKNTRRIAEYVGKIYDNVGTEARRVSIGLNKGAVGFGLGTATDARATERFSNNANAFFGYLNAVNMAKITSG